MIGCAASVRRTAAGRGETAAVPPALAALGVTSRELDVLALIRQGNTNAQIATRLFLSIRTVETHVAHLLTKTGAGPGSVGGDGRRADRRPLRADPRPVPSAAQSNESGQEHSNR